MNWIGFILAFGCGAVFGFIACAAIVVWLGASFVQAVANSKSPEILVRGPGARQGRES